MHLFANSCCRDRHKVLLNLWFWYIAAHYFGDEFDETTFVAPFEHEDVALAFFKVNWWWFLIAIILIILLFLVPGMLMQIYCNKFYIFYRSVYHETAAIFILGCMLKVVSIWQKGKAETKIDFWWSYWKYWQWKWPWYDWFV